MLKSLKGGKYIMTFKENIKQQKQQIFRWMHLCKINRKYMLRFNTQTFLNVSH